MTTYTQQRNEKQWIKNKHLPDYIYSFASLWYIKIHVPCPFDPKS